MKFRFDINIIVLFVFLPVLVNAQADSTLIRNDSLKVRSDSLLIRNDSLKVPGDSLMSKEKEIVDTLKPKYQSLMAPEDGTSQIINSNAIEELDYKNIYQILNYSSYTNTNYLGRIGQPSETYHYGYGNGAVSYFRDGVFLNNRLFNSFYPAMYSVENADSLEFVPLSRGFLFGSEFNPIAVNHISKDRIVPVPFSRIRFYQAPDDEEMINVTFSAYVSSKLNATIDIGSRATDSYFDNSEFAEWHASTKFHYLLSNRVNLIADFDYYYRNGGLYGGVDKDSIDNSFIPSETENTLFSNLEAPVNYGISSFQNRSSRYEKEFQYSYSLKVLLDLIPLNSQDITFYYLSSLREFRQSERMSVGRITALNNNNAFDSYGINYKHKLDLSFININAYANFERQAYDSPLISNSERDILSLSGIAHMNFFERTFIPSGFLKYSVIDGMHYFGAGADGILSLNKSVSFYGGFSAFVKPLGIFESQFLSTDVDETISNLEIKALYNSKTLDFGLGYFVSIDDNSPEPLIEESQDNKLVNETGTFTRMDKKYSGISGNFKLKFSFLEIQSKADFYIEQHANDYYSIPQFSLVGSIHYIDTLFRGNLEFRAGVNYKLYGPRDFLSYDFQTSRAIRYYKSGQYNYQISDNRLESEFQLDLFFAGRIQKSAILYVTYENILGNEYYIIPYYPITDGGLRIGVSWNFLN